jgi:threonyl-tRNA synthetase
MLTVGDQEVENKTVALRTRDNVVLGQIAIDDFLNKIEQERKTRSLNSVYGEKCHEKSDCCQ